MASHQDGRDIFEILVRENAEMLSAYLRSLIGADPALDDLFQATMIVAWKRLADYDRTRPFGAWLRGIARMLVMEHVRKTSSSRLTSADARVLDELDARYSAFTEGGVSFPERSDQLLRCLASLPEAMREVVDMVYARGMLLKQIALAIGIAEETLKKRIQRARMVLAECVRGSEGA